MSVVLVNLEDFNLNYLRTKIAVSEIKVEFNNGKYF